jgi:hypothetical protein
MEMTKRIILLFLIVFGPISGLAQKRHALVVGIGQYEDSRWGSIHGDTDVDYAVAMLKANGFKDIRTLRNADATKRAILSAFRSLKSRCGRGDKVYIHFSGHGQQVTDLDGDEDDGYDEAWIPYDAQPYYSASYRGENHLTDDELNGVLTQIRMKIGPSGRMLVVVDACHSGSATREPGDTTVARGFDRKFEIPGKKPNRRKPAPEEWITLSACQSYQVNWELTRPAVGKLTWSLHELGDRLHILSNQELEASIARIMQENPGPLSQTPAMTGCLDTESVKDLFE